ncbi:sesquiterpene synthase Cop-like [Apium graveolens]|uniref:sesquiterpene synthase Cop-like n=1 Tax=Apium graveolens TaxID=4045 RepID=UPI003D78D671
MSVFLQASSAPSSLRAAEPEIVRRSSNYHPCVWGDHFLAYNTPDHATPDKDTIQKIEVLKEEVKKMLLKAAHQPQQQLKLIDDIQRLGLAYRFNVEIDVALKRMNEMHHELCRVKNMNDLHFVALCFRLLRQHGYNVSSDVFNKFKDESTGIFKESLNKDVDGLLSLYEATHLRVHGEDILEEALAFTTSHLESLKSQLKDPLATHVIRALEIPLWKSVNRVEARHYISLYGEDDSHSKTLLCLAKLDYNLLQKLYQCELGKISSWWKNLHLKEKMPFARHRVVECYFWAIGTSFEPQYVLARSFLTKLLALVTVVDDMYDVYGTIEELTLFTEAIQKWDIGALDQLPEYMKCIYQVVLDFHTEVEEELMKAGLPISRAQYAKDAMKKLVRSYIFEAKCVNKCIVPSMDEYMPHSLIGTTIPILAVHFMVGMGDIVTKETLEWLSSFPLIIRATSLYCRLTDDMAEDKVGKAEDTAYVVGCYMRQHGVSREHTFAEFEKQKTQAWKDMNSECLRPTAVPIPLLMVALSSSRLVYVCYEYQNIDGYTTSDTKTKELLRTLLVDPIPM